MDTTKLFKWWILKKCYGVVSNLEEMAQEFDETKFFGYHTEDLLEALGEFTKHLEPYECFPRLYFSYEGGEHLICYEFVPGSHFNVLLYDYEESDADALYEMPEKKGWYLF